MKLRQDHVTFSKTLIVELINSMLVFIVVLYSVLHNTGDRSGLQVGRSSNCTLATKPQCRMSVSIVWWSKQKQVWCCSKTCMSVWVWTVLSQVCRVPIMPWARARQSKFEICQWVSDELGSEVCRQQLSEVFLSSCSYILYTVIWVLMQHYLRGVKCWFWLLPLSCRDFSGFSKSINDFMDCRCYCHITHCFTM